VVRLAIVEKTEITVRTVITGNGCGSITRDIKWTKAGRAIVSNFRH
jgi:hypothetical protein